MQRRLCRAITLLGTSDLSIAEVAEVSGFSDSNYFSVIFQKLLTSLPAIVDERFRRGSGTWTFSFLRRFILIRR